MRFGILVAAKCDPDRAAEVSNGLAGEVSHRLGPVTARRAEDWLRELARTFMFAIDYQACTLERGKVSKLPAQEVEFQEWAADRFYAAIRQAWPECVACNLVAAMLAMDIADRIGGCHESA